MFRYSTESFASGRAMYKRSNEEPKTISVTIPEGAGVTEIAKILENSGVIQSALIFQVESYLLGARKGYVPNTYNLNTNMDSYSIRKTLRSAGATVSDNEVRVVIREGLTIKEIGEVLESNEVITKDAFVEACRTEKFDYYFLNEIPERENYLEGYLFPDTYIFLKNMEPRQVINKMLTRFNDIFKDDFRVKAAELGLTVDNIVTIASIIEKEVRIPTERHFVSAVIYNRLKTQMNLQMCSTVLYTAEKKRDKILESDLKKDTPYNTYTKAGLPIGPIGNPGLACIEATLAPAQVNYLYFVVKDEATGEHVFTDNYDVFLKAKADYNQKY